MTLIEKLQEHLRAGGDSKVKVVFQHEGIVHAYFNLEYDGEDFAPDLIRVVKDYSKHIWDVEVLGPDDWVKLFELSF